MEQYCDYHGEKRHLTNDCHNLKEQPNKEMEIGKLDHLIRDVRQRDRAPLGIITKPIKDESQILFDIMGMDESEKSWIKKKIG